MAGDVLMDEPADGVRRLTLSNPAKRNALDQPMLDLIAQGVRSAEPDGVRCLLLTGAGAMFSSGYDIADIPTDVFAREAERLVAHPFADALDALDATNVPTLAALPGHTIGGGLEIAVACDLRLAADGIRLGMPPAKLGLVYSHTGLRRFVRTVGEPRTRELFLLGRTISAAAAREWGLVHAVVGAADLEGEALEWASELAANAPMSVRGNKRVLRALVSAETLAPDVEAEIMELRRACFASEDFKEGVRAFAEKRPARWQDR